MTCTWGKEGTLEPPNQGQQGTDPMHYHSLITPEPLLELNSVRANGTYVSQRKNLLHRRPPLTRLSKVAFLTDRVENVESGEHLLVVARYTRENRVASGKE